MASLPLILPNGIVLVYGWGYEGPGASGLTPDNTLFKFGTVYQIWDGGAVFVYNGDSIFWRDGDGSDPSGPVVCKLTYSGNPFTMLKAKLVTKEILPP